VEGELDAVRFGEALRAVAAEHEVLRTSFRTAPGLRVPVQVVHDRAVPVVLRVEGDNREPIVPPALMGRLRSECGFGDDVAAPPLFRHALVEIEGALRYWYVVASALCSDGAGLENYVAAVARAYSLDTDDDEGNGPLQYADIAEWLNQALEAEEAEPGRAYWRQRASAARAMRLPFERVVPEGRAFDPALRCVTVSAPMLEGLERLASSAGVELEVVLLAAWRLLLYRLSGAENASLGWGSVRALRELRDVVGVIRQDLPVSLPVAPSATARELLLQAAATLQEAREWQDSFDAERLEPAEADALAFTFAFDEGRGAMQAGGARLSVVERFSCLRRFKLGLSCWRTPQALTLGFYYDQVPYREGDVELCEGRYLALLGSIVDAPDGAVRSLGVLPPAERHKLLRDLNRTDFDYPAATCIHELIATAADRNPQGVAVIQRDRQLAYAELMECSDELASQLAARGAGPGVRVGLCVERSIEMIVGILGILRSGAAYVPLDPKYPRERLAFMTRDSGARLLLTRRGLADRLDSHHAEILFLEELGQAAAPADRAARAAGPDDPVYVIYTSGSTGQPKGVPITHRNLASSTTARSRFYGEPVRRFMLLSSFAFDSSIAGIFWTLCDGGTLYLPEQGEEQDVQALGRIVSEQGITHTLCLPSIYALLLSEVPASRLASLTDVIVAGEACSPALTKAHHRILPAARLHNEYGPTEATVWTTGYTVEEPIEAGPVPIGRPVANARVYVLDDALEPVPFGCPGELVVGGAGVARGYLDRSELTRERFLDDPFSGGAGARMYRTGDIVRYLEDGNLEFLGRADGQIKIRGYRVELGEIENALTAHPSVGEAVVLAVEQKQHKRLVGYLTVRDGAARPGRPDLRDLLQSRLPEYMIPAAFVLLDRFPRMPNGKVDRGALPAPDWKTTGDPEPAAPPRNEIERELVEVWCKVLRIEEVGVHDNYFELGGDSILSIRMVSEAHRRGLQITPMQLFSHQTIAELAGVVGRNGRACFDQGPVTGPVGLTPIQRWWLEQDLEDSHHWNMSTLLDVLEPLDSVLLERAAAELVEHHDALRLRLEKTGAGWSQRIDEPPGNLRLETIDLSHLATTDQERELGVAATRVQASLDPAAGPLMALGLFDLGGGRSRLLLAVHHIAVDGVSWPILLEDLATAYGQISRGEEVRLLAKTASYKHWSERLRAHSREAELVRESSYWLASPPPAPSLPRDGHTGRDTVAAARVHTVYLAADATDALLRAVPEAYRTQVNDALLTAVLDGFWIWTGRPELLITLEGHGREDVGEALDVSRTVGWFTSLFPATLVRADADSPGERLKEVKEQLRAVPRRGIGYGLLRYLSDDEAISQSLRERPQPEVGFNYLGQFDPGLGGSKLFRLREQSAGSEQSPRASRREPLEIVAMVAGDQLRIDWVYSENRHRRETIETLAQQTLAALQSLIDHCSSPEAGGYTPSDFPDADLDQETLDRLLAQID
jgi:amino acid adenylation domain-containing protein/non-ribosomal peptide synthase protein (TIGR01720 family)